MATQFSTRRWWILPSVFGVTLLLLLAHLVYAPSLFIRHLTSQISAANLARAHYVGLALGELSLEDSSQAVTQALAPLLAHSDVVYARCFVSQPQRTTYGEFGQSRISAAQLPHPEAMADSAILLGDVGIAVVRLNFPQDQFKARNAPFAIYLVLESDHEAQLSTFRISQWASWGLCAILALLAFPVAYAVRRAMTRASLAVEQANRSSSQAQAASATKSMFLANMSHELRTPMNGVLGMAELLLNSELAPKQRKHVHTIRRSGHALLAIINDVLDFARVESGQLTLEFAEFDPRDRIEDVIDPLRVRAEEKGVHLEVDCATDVPANIVGDPNRLQQILTNLVGNAVKFTEQGSVTVGVRTCDVSHGSVSLEFSVRDTGIGIAPEYQNRLFVAFFQGDPSMNRRFGGTGLGLAISRQLVTLMGGDIRVQSEPGRGSTFAFTANFSVPESSTMLVRPSLDAINALIVAESEPQRRYLQQLLELWSITTTSAATPEQAGEILQTSHQLDHNLLPAFDVVVIDRISPTLDALHFATRLQENKQLRGEAVVILSAPGKTTPADLLDAGVHAVLRKPLRQGDLYKTMRGLRDKKRATSSVERAPAPMPSGFTAASQQLSLTRASGNDAWSTDAKTPHGFRLSTPENQHIRILIAEDNDTNVEVVSALLETLGYSFDIVGDGKACLQKATGDQIYDLILMDCQMPDMDGYEAARKIRHFERSQGKSRTPIVALSAHASPEHQREAMYAGMNAHICKPLELEKLAAALKFALTSQKPGEPSSANAPLSATVEIMGPLNARKLERLRQLETPARPNFFANLVNTYLEQSQCAWDHLQVAFAAADHEQIRSIAHTLAGSSEYITAAHFAGRLRRLHEMADKLEQARALLPLLEREFMQVRSHLQQMLAQLPAKEQLELELELEPSVQSSAS